MMSRARSVKQGRGRRIIPGVDDMQHRLAEELLTDVAPKALARLSILIDSPDERVAVAAAKVIIDKAIATPKSTSGESVDPDDIARMSQTDLATLIGRLEGELSERAKDVTPKATYEFLN